MNYAGREVRGFGRNKPGPWAQVDWSHPLARDLRVHLTCAEACGPAAADAAGHGRAVFNKLPSWKTGRTTASAVNLALTTDQVMELPQNAAFKPTAGLTVAAWISPDATLALLPATINYNYVACVDYRFDGTWNSPWVSWDLGWAVGQSATPVFGVTVAGNLSSATSPTALPLGQWVHLAGTYDGANIKIYVNGILMASVAQTGAIDYGPGALVAPLSVGNVSSQGLLATPSQLLNGRLEEFRVYGRALSAAEIHWIKDEPYAHLQAPYPRTPIWAFVPPITAALGVQSRTPAVAAAAAGTLAGRLTAASRVPVLGAAGTQSLATTLAATSPAATLAAAAGQALGLVLQAPAAPTTLAAAATGSLGLALAASGAPAAAPLGGRQALNTALAAAAGSAGASFGGSQVLGLTLAAAAPSAATVHGASQALAAALTAAAAAAAPKLTGASGTSIAAALGAAASPATIATVGAGSLGLILAPASTAATLADTGSQSLPTILGSTAAAATLAAAGLTVAASGTVLTAAAGPGSAALTAVATLGTALGAASPPAATALAPTQSLGASLTALAPRSTLDGSGVPTLAAAAGPAAQAAAVVLIGTAAGGVPTFVFTTNFTETIYALSDYTTPTTYFLPDFAVVTHYPPR